MPLVTIKIKGFKKKNNVLWQHMVLQKKDAAILCSSREE